MDETRSILLPDVEHKDIPDFLSEYDWFDADISENILDVTEVYERPVYSLAYHGAPFAPLGGIHALTGQSGNGKTMTFTMMMVALLKGEYMGLSRVLPDGEPVRVLYIDTEMERGNTQLVNLRVYSLMGWEFGVPHDEFKVVCLREETKAEDRWKKTLKAIYELKPTVCFIDGLLDVISDFNNNEACQQIIYNCMATASHYGISLWCLVHQNPGSTKMVGHLGSMLERKVTDMFSTIKHKDGGNVTFSIEQKKSRGRDVEDMKFFVVPGRQNLGEPQMIEAQDEAKEEPEIDKRSIMKQIITSQDGISTRDLVTAIKGQLKVGQDKAVKFIWECESDHIITRDDRKRYHLSDNSTNEETLFENEKEEECPF